MVFGSFAQRNRRRGFSLVEVLIVTTIFSILSTMFYRVFIMNVNAYHRRILQAELWSEAHQIIAMVRNDVFSADRVHLVLVEDDNQIEQIRILRNQTVVVQYNLIDGGLAVFERSQGGGSVFYDRDGRNIIADSSWARLQDSAVNVIMLNLVLRRRAPGGALRIEMSYQIFVRDGMEVIIL